MPQLDKVTFLSQYFWLCFFYFGFYYVLLKFYLPQISRIFSLRQKKIGTLNQETTTLVQENEQVRRDSQELLSRAFILSKTSFNTFFSQTMQWISQNETKMNKTHYKKVNKSFLKKLRETSLSDALLLSYAEKQVPENDKVTFQILETVMKKSQLLKKTPSGLLLEKAPSGLEEIKTPKKTQKTQKTPKSQTPPKTEKEKKLKSNDRSFALYYKMNETKLPENE